MKRSDKKPDPDKSINYKNLISQYYDRDPLLSDLKQQLTPIAPDINILE